MSPSIDKGRSLARTCEERFRVYEKTWIFRSGGSLFVNTIAVPDATIGYTLPNTMDLLKEFMPDAMKQMHKNILTARQTKAGSSEDTDACGTPATPPKAP